MRGFVLAFRKTKMLVYAYVLLNASVIAKNDGCPPFFFDAFVRTPSTFGVQQNKKAGKLHLPVFLWWR